MGFQVHGGCFGWEELRTVSVDNFFRLNDWCFQLCQFFDSGGKRTLSFIITLLKLPLRFFFNTAINMFLYIYRARSIAIGAANILGICAGSDHFIYGAIWHTQCSILLTLIQL